MKLAKKISIFLLFGFILALPLTVFAATEKMDQSIYVGADEIIDGNFIKAGNIINIEGAVKGDVIVAGNSIQISGPVGGDVIAAGNLIKITGPVGGSIRVVGSTIEITNEVKRNVWAAGSNILIGKEANVGLDVYAAGASVQIKSNVEGNIWAGAATIVLSGQTGKDVTASIDKEGQVILESGAKINGNLTYKAAEEKQLIIKEGAVVSGQTTKQELASGRQVDGRFFGAALFFFKIVSFFSLLVIGLILITLLTKKILAVKDEMIKSPMPSIGWGLIYLVMTPIVCILLFFTVIGIPLAFIILPLYFIVLCLSKIIAGFAIGVLAIDRLTNNKYRGSLIWPLALGIFIFIIISSIPIIGWLFGFVAMLWALGALINITKQAFKELR